ncbi:54S ribosomal protein L2, mitochondrial [Scheffersomyces coipomensis]|uniref:54S ribosomal protein L2, mitochondrial n=1 Tax=Scheffersomyces coipomensis TaxID=1788519 RepID=UPI00315CA680
MLRSIAGLARGSSGTQSLALVTLNNNLTQIRTATKRVSGSKTNKNDSAGRRLGPKAYEGNYVKPGTIIMRQRGTKIHPGENVRIGIDHTIYAVEPGYVRFYLDPFHPLRKYVGVSLQKDVKLPIPHFEPRVRRFGYIELQDPEQAQKEEDRKSRKEYLYQSQLEQKALQKENFKNDTITKFKEVLQKEFAVTDKDVELASTRFFNILTLSNAGHSIESAKTQETYNYFYSLKLSVQKGELSKEEESTKRSEYLTFKDQIESQVNLDVNGSLYKYLTPEEVSTKQKEITQKLETEYYKVLSPKEKTEVSRLINTAGIFSVSERQSLTNRFLPSFVPYDVPGSVIEDIDPENIPKDVVAQRVFDEATRKAKLIGRPKAALA